MPGLGHGEWKSCVYMRRAPWCDIMHEGEDKQLEYTMHEGEVTQLEQTHGFTSGCNYIFTSTFIKHMFLHVCNESRSWMESCLLDPMISVQGEKLSRLKASRTHLLHKSLARTHA